MKSWFKYILMAVLYGAFTTSCAPEDDLVSALYDKSYVTLSRVVIPLDNNDNTKEHITVESVRVLIFDGISGNIISNTLVSGDNNISGSYDASHNAYIISLNNTSIAAYAGNHDVYAVLNENAFEANLGLGSVKTKTGMDDIKNQPVPYNTIMAVPTNQEPPFLMCTYDKVNIPSGSTAANPFVIDMTGLDAGDYAFSMRRSMAKIVLESVIGGVRPDGTIVGTTTKWNGNVNVDQIPDDTDNQDLIATSAVHILGVELINVPNQFYWNHDGSDPTTQSPYNVTYHTDAIPIATSDFNLTEKYFEREWPGIINGTGEVEFTRTDAMYSMWKIQKNSGSNAYAVYDPKDIEANPDKYYYWGISGGSIPMPSTGIKCDIPYSDAMKTASNFSHYTIDENGIIHLFDTSGREFDAPNNSMYTLNKGNFIKFFQENYGNMSGNFVPGRPIAGAMKTTPYIDPSVWSLKFNNVSYYIPENITNNSDNYTKLRITASVAIPTVKLDPDEVNKAINAQGGSGELVGEEGMIDMTDENIINYLYAKGEMLPHPTKEGYYALAYAGLKRMYKGTVTVSNAEGRYEKMSGFDAQVVTFEIPLNNDEIEGGTDVNQNHNIYRGHEYRVKLYVTRSNENWPSRNAGADSRTINIGGEELTITGKVTASPIK